METSSKNIVIYSDGTGNAAVKNRGTNVFKVFESVDIHGHRDNQGLPLQVGFYHDGVGTEGNAIYKILGNAFGVGLSNHVKELYLELVRVYNPGDKIFLFGFSRGAFTVRTLAGFILGQGILKREEYVSHLELQDAVQASYEEYRKKYRALIHNTWRSVKKIAFGGKAPPSDHFHREDLTIEFIGVWDTVDAYGFPFDFVADFWNKFIFRFKFNDRKLNPSVAKACHAVAIDDERHTFHPVMWNEQGETPGRIEQVWFAGVHSNVGGGYPKQGMSLASLEWMMGMAESHGLRFIPEEREYFRTHVNVHDKIYNSRSGAAIYYRYLPRDIHAICAEAQCPPKMHPSALERLAQGSEGYAPGNLPVNLQVVGKDGKAEPLPESIKKEFHLLRSPLDKMRLYIQIRRWSQWGLFLLTGIFIFSFFLWNPNLLSGIPTESDLLKMTIQLIFYSGSLGICFLISCAAIYFISGLARNKIQRTFSEFWYPLLPQLRKNYFPALENSAVKEKEERIGQT